MIDELLFQPWRYPSNWWDNVIEVKSWVTALFERAFRGYSHRDLWGFDHYLSQMLVGSITEFKRIKHGHPILCGNHNFDDPNNCKCEEMWNATLDDIINGCKDYLDEVDYSLPSKEMWQYEQAAYQHYQNSLHVLADYIGHIWD